MKPMIRMITLSTLLVALILSCTIDDDTSGGSGNGIKNTTNAPLYTDSRWIKDNKGRVVILRGINMVGGIKHKNAETGLYQYNLVAEDWDNLHHWGFNVARLLMNWDANEPKPDKYDDKFLDRVEQQVKWAQERGIYVFLDMHQDTWGPAFDGNGAPEWASVTDIPFERNPWWGLNYFAPAVIASFDNFWKSDHLQKHFAKMWAHVAKRFQKYPNVIGYDLLNEPNFGSITPWLYERKYLGRFYDRVGAEIRKVDPDRIIFIESFGYGGGGAPTYLPPSSIKRNLAYAPHYYDPGTGIVHSDPYDMDPSRIENAMILRDREALAMGDIPWLYGEFGISGGENSDQYVRDIYDRLENHMAGSTYWDYGKGGMGPLDGEGNEKPRADDMVRPYPMKIAGVPVSFKFDRDTNIFTLTIKEDPSINAPTEIYIPEDRHYPDGFVIESTGLTWSYEWDGRILKWHSDKELFSNTIIIRPDTPLAAAVAVEIPEVLPEEETTSLTADVRAASNNPGVICNDAEAILRSQIVISTSRTEAYFMYKKVLKLTDENDPDDVRLQARAHLGLGLINFYDTFDFLPVLLNLLGINLNELLGGLAPSTKPTRQASTRACTPVNFGGYLTSIDAIAVGIFAPAIEHFRKAMELDPDVSIYLENGMIVLATDSGLTPAVDETLALDLTGEWDAGDVGTFTGILDIALFAFKLMSSYDGLIQSLLNASLTPDCNPAPGSDEWLELFGPYGVLNADGGEQRMIEAGEYLADAFRMLGLSFAYIAAETDNQGDDVFAYLDCGLDGLCPGMDGYTAPDEGELNGMYDEGEIWGIESIADLLGGLIGGILPFPLEDITKMLPLTLLADLMNDMQLSVETGAPVDLVRSLLVPLVGALGVGDLPDKVVYDMYFPALNLSAPFSPPWPSIAIIEPLKDAGGGVIVDVESGDETHTWPDGSGRIDPANDVVDPAYSFYPDLNEAGASVGVLGGLLYEAVTEDGDFDIDGFLIGELEYEPMMNPIFNAFMTNIMELLGALFP